MQGKGKGTEKVKKKRVKRPKANEIVGGNLMGNGKIKSEMCECANKKLSGKWTKKKRIFKENG